jgi:hypothetical protein
MLQRWWHTYSCRYCMVKRLLCCNDVFLKSVLWIRIGFSADPVPAILGQFVFGSGASILIIKIVRFWSWKIIKKISCEKLQFFVLRPPWRTTKLSALIQHFETQNVLTFLLLWVIFVLHIPQHSLKLCQCVCFRVKCNFLLNMYALTRPTTNKETGG